MAKNREHLKQARSIAILRDERKGRLLVRFRACRGDDLTVCSGVLGLKTVEGSADSLAKATNSILEEFCSPFHMLPRDCQQPHSEGPHGAPLVKHIKDHVTIMVTDAAPSELLSSEQLRGRRSYANTTLNSCDFKNLTLVGRDGAHGSTRVLKRPFNHHPAIEAVMSEFISSSDSFGQKIFHSPLFSMWWKEALNDGCDDNGPGLASIAAAKHRFGSFLQPLSRISKNQQAMLTVCHRIEAMRGSGGAWASSILNEYTARKALMLSMAADAAATAMELTRFLDHEDADIAQINQKVQEFSLQCRSLFWEKKIFTLPTYTKHMLDQLEQRPLTVMGAVPREVRVTEGDKSAALKVFQAGFRSESVLKGMTDSIFQFICFFESLCCTLLRRNGFKVLKLP